MAERRRPDPDRPPHVRANALTAAAFHPLVDVDPRVVDALLDALEDAGVAAYAQPVTAGENLWVDAERRDLAAAVVAGELPGLLAELEGPDRMAVDPDAEFAAIVARFADDPQVEVAPWPVSEDLDEAPRPKDAEGDGGDGDRPAATWSDDDGDAVDVSVEVEEEHFVPPPPPPLPAISVTARLAVLAIVVGVCFVFGWQRHLGFPTGDAAFAFGILLLAGGAGTLVWRLRDAPPVDDGPDDGAVV